MRNILVALVLFLAVPSVVFAQQSATATLTWDSNTEPDISRYIMHRGTASGVYDTTLDVPHVPAIPRQVGKFLALTEGQTYFFVVSACDTSGNCSGFSNEVSKLIAIVPGVPGNLGVTVDINVTITVP